MANALSLVGGVEAEATAKFVRIVDRFFDCMNVATYTEGKLQRNPFKQPYRSPSDFRLKVNIQSHACKLLNIIFMIKDPIMHGHMILL